MRRVAEKIGADANQIEADRRSALAAELLKIKLELADTFCKLALESHSRPEMQLYQANARASLDAAFHVLTKVHMSEGGFEGLVTRIEEVKALVESLEAGGVARASC